MARTFRGSMTSKVRVDRRSGVARVYSPPCPWDTHYQFSIKTLLSRFTNEAGRTLHSRFGRLALTDRSVGHGRYRRSVRFNLRDNTVDIDGRFGYTYGELRSISTVGSVHSTQKLVDIDHIGRFIQKKIGRRSI